MSETAIGRALAMLTESQTARDIRDAHRDFYLALAERAEPELHGPDQVAWLDVLEAEHDNLRAAIGWGLAQGDGDSALRMAAALGEFWRRHGHAAEARGWVERAVAASPSPSALKARALAWLGSAQDALTMAREAGDDSATARALNALSFQAWQRRSYTEARSFAEEALRLSRGAKNRVLTGWALLHLSGAVWGIEEPGRGRPFLEEALAIAREVGDVDAIARALTSLVRTTEPASARAAMAHEALELFRELKDDFSAAWLHDAIAWDTFHGEGVGPARAAWEEALRLERGLIEPSPWLGHRLNCLGVAAQAAGDVETARARFEEARDVGDGRNRSWALWELAWLALQDGDSDTALSLAQEAGGGGVAGILRARGDYVGARAAYEEELEAAKTLGDKRRLMRAMHGLGMVAMLEGDLDRARSLFEDAPVEGAAGSDMHLAELALVQGDLERAWELHRRALAAWRDGADPQRWGIPWSFEGLARVAAAQGRLDAATRLLGAADAFRERFGCVRNASNLSLDYTPNDDYHEAIGRLRSDLGDAVFKTAWDEGRAMSEDEAVAYALQTS